MAKSRSSAQEGQSQLRSTRPTRLSPAFGLYERARLQMVFQGPLYENALLGHDYSDINN